MQAPHGKQIPVAVALKHDPGEVPVVVASGKGDLARRILDLAFASGVKVREDADLAQMLSAIELNQDIPLEAFEAVAEILNYLYRLNGGPPAEAAAGPTPRTPVR